MSDFIEVEVWVVVNADGEYEVAADQDTVCERWAESDCIVGTAQRLIQVKLQLPKPKPVVVTATLPAEPTDGVKVKVV